MGEAFPTLHHVPRAVLRALLWLPRVCWRKRPRILLVLMAIHLTATLVTGWMLRRELDRMRQAGLPMEAADVLTPLQLEWNQTGVSADNPNAAWVYEHAFQSLQITEEEQEEYDNLPAPGEARDEGGRVTPEEAKAARLAFAGKVIPKNEHYFSILEEASRIPDCAFPVDWSAGPNMLFRHLSSLRQAGRWLQFRAELLASEGRADEAVECCAIMFRIAEHIKTEPTLISQFVAYALQSMGCRSLEDALSAGDPSPTACRALYGQIAAIDQVSPFVRTMHAERVLFGMDIYQRLRRNPFYLREIMTLSDGRQKEWMILYPTLGRPLFNLDEITYVRFMRDTAAAAGRRWPEVSNKMSAAQRERLDRVPLYRSVVAKMITPVFSKGVEWRESTTALLGAARIALALKMYRAEHGDYPPSLAPVDAVEWGMPRDPFTQEPYHYRREGQGFLVWSVGPNMEDDGGVSRDRLQGMSVEEREREKYNYDIPFRCAR